MMSRLILSVVLLTSFASYVHAQASGKADYQSKCIACHGQAAQGVEALQSPSLAGQSSAYLERQLLNFKSGLRGAHPDDALGKQMQAIVIGLDAAQITALSNYLASLPLVPQASPVQGDIKRGEKYYQSYCGSCHGAKGQGNELLFSPNLALLNSEYFLQQYRHFLNGVRGSNKQDKYGRQMALIARGLTDEAIINDIAAYLAGGGSD